MKRRTKVILIIVGIVALLTLLTCALFFLPCSVPTISCRPPLLESGLTQTDRVRSNSTVEAFAYYTQTALASTSLPPVPSITPEDRNP
jgi:hypothetical protein